MAMWATSPEYVDEVPMMQLVEGVLLHILGPLHPRFMREIESWNLTTAASFHFLIQCWQFCNSRGDLGTSSRIFIQWLYSFLFWLMYSKSCWQISRSAWKRSAFEDACLLDCSTWKRLQSWESEWGKSFGPYIVSSRFLIPAWLVVLDVFNVSIPFFPFHMDLSTIPLDVLRSVVWFFFLKRKQRS